MALHFVPKSATLLSEILEKNFRLPAERVDLLLSLGAISERSRRFFADAVISPGTHLLIHNAPTRFPVESVEWRSIVVADERDLLVVNKPGGIPVHGTPDNARENLLEQLRLHLNRDLFVTQRLDTPVSGLMVLAKTKRFQEQFNALLREGKVEKRYVALTATMPPIGRQVHFLIESREKKKRMVDQEQPGTSRCELEVLETKAWGELFESKIRPLTGRTHQIRAQLAKIGCPVANDSLYGYRGARWEKKSPRREIGLASESVAFLGKRFALPVDWR